MGRAEQAASGSLQQSPDPLELNRGAGGTREQREMPTASARAGPPPGPEAPFSGVPSGAGRLLLRRQPQHVHGCHTHHPRERPLRHSNPWLLQGPPQPRPDFPQAPVSMLTVGAQRRPCPRLSNVLDRHLRCPLLWARSERRGCPRGRPLAAPGTRDAGAPAAPACSLQPPPLPLCLPAGGCQGARHGSRLACCLIYASQGRRAGSRGAEGKPGAGVGGAGWSRHPRRRREGPRF